MNTPGGFPPVHPDYMFIELCAIWLLYTTWLKQQEEDQRVKVRNGTNAFLKTDLDSQSTMGKIPHLNNVGNILAFSLRHNCEGAGCTRLCFWILRNGK